MLYASRKYPHDKEGCKKIISDALYDLRFIYEKPDEEVSTFIIVGIIGNVITDNQTSCQLRRSTVDHFAPHIFRRYTLYIFRRFTHSQGVAFRLEDSPLRRLRYKYQFLASCDRTLKQFFRLNVGLGFSKRGRMC